MDNSTPNGAGALHGAGTLHLDDRAFLAAFAAASLANESFRHADHIRLARLFLRMHGEHAADRICGAILRFARAKGGESKYHETVTRAWMRLVAAAAPASTFEGFAAANPDLFDKDALHRYYSRERLAADEARIGWTPPDLRPLP